MQRESVPVVLTIRPNYFLVYTYYQFSLISFLQKISFHFCRKPVLLGFCEMSQKTRVCVIGAGVVGLSSAVRIQEELPHCDVTLLADRFSPDTTSDGSGGFWLLHLVGGVSQDLLR